MGTLRRNLTLVIMNDEDLVIGDLKIEESLFF